VWGECSAALNSKHSPHNPVHIYEPTHKQSSITFLLVVALLLFGTGVFFPFFHVTKFWLFDDAVSVVGGIITLFREGEYFLFAVLTLFTLVFPCVKLGLLGIIWLERDHDLARVHRLHHWVEALGKWSMLDVFVVAILIVAMKSAAVAEIHIGLGLYLFTFSVIATQFASAWVAGLLERK
jgi:paraquat-inducible protein A